MSFLPEWFSQGTNAYDAASKFGQAGMFDQPNANQRGDLTGLVNALRNRFSAMPNQQDKGAMPEMNAMPSFTPYQTTPMGPDFNINNAYGMSPNGSIMPNWNRR